MITRKTEKILLFINERFKEQIKHNGQLEDKEIVMYAIKTDFDFLNTDILRDEIAEYKRNGEINYIQNELLRIAEENFELYNHLKNEPFDFPATHFEDYLITTKGNLTWDQWKLSDNKKMFPIEPEFIYDLYHNRQFVSYCENVIDWIKKNVLKTPENTIKDEGIELNLSDTKANEKIIYLKELGILDILKSKQPFNTSINALATLLSAITSENNTTLQSYINPMFSPDTENKNNPYNNKKTVEKVQNQLIKIGFQLK